MLLFFPACSFQSPPDDGALKRNSRGPFQDDGRNRFFSDSAHNVQNGPVRQARWSQVDHRALASCLSMILSENRYALFRIML
jgi:hypothetical protein